MELRRHSSHQIPAPHLLQSVPEEDVATILERLEDDDLSFHEFSRSLVPHPAIAAAIIRAVNSVSLGNQQPVQSLRHALTLLGLNRTRSVLQELSQERYSTVGD